MGGVESKTEEDEEVREIVEAENRAKLESSQDEAETAFPPEKRKRAFFLFNSS